MIKCCFLVFLFFSVYGQDLTCLTGSSTECDFGNGAFTLTIPAGIGIFGKTIFAQSLTLIGAGVGQQVEFSDTTFIGFQHPGTMRVSICYENCQQMESYEDYILVCFI